MNLEKTWRKTKQIQKLFIMNYLKIKCMTPCSILFLKVEFPPIKSNTMIKLCTNTINFLKVVFPPIKSNIMIKLCTNTIKYLMYKNKLINMKNQGSLSLLQTLVKFTLGSKDVGLEMKSLS